MSSEQHTTAGYIKIWAVLLGLLIVSVLGPMLGVKVLTMITAFGIAIVKALIIAAYFMHLNIEKKYISYLLVGMLVLVVVFFFGVAPDIMRTHGQNWTKSSSVKLIKSNEGWEKRLESH